MLKKRIIPCLDIRDGKVVKGVNFKQLRLAGDPVELAKRYVDEGADELVFLDISATNEKRKTWTKLVQRIAREVDIPFTVGGGIALLADAQAVIEAGADKVSVNSAAVQRPKLINEIAQEFGNQCVVLAVDTKHQYGRDVVYTHGGTRASSLNTDAWVLEAVQRGAGEILLTSMDADGTKAGFDLAITRKISQLLSVPVIASGGAGRMQDFETLFAETRASAALAASIFHFGEVPIPELKKYLINNKIPIRWI